MRLARRVGAEQTFNPPLRVDVARPGAPLRGLPSHRPGDRGDPVDHAEQTRTRRRADISLRPRDRESAPRADVVGRRSRRGERRRHGSAGGVARTRGRQGSADPPGRSPHPESLGLTGGGGSKFGNLRGRRRRQGRNQRRAVRAASSGSPITRTRTASGTPMGSTSTILRATEPPDRGTRRTTSA